MKVRDVLATAALVVLVSGCYFDVRPGVTAPVGHGHGGGGFDLGVAVGGEYASPKVRVGGGANFGPRIASDNGYEPIGVEAHAVVPLAGDPIGSQHRLLLTTHASIAGAIGSAKFGAGMQPSAPDGAVTEIFVGLGVGATTTQPDYHVVAGHLALGLSAKRFWPLGGDGFWMIGAALEFSYSWQNGGVWAH